MKKAQNLLIFIVLFLIPFDINAVFTLNKFILKAKQGELVENTANINSGELQQIVSNIIKQKKLLLSDYKINKNLLSESLANTRSEAEKKITYIEKIIVNGEREIAFIGDIHGSAQALAEDIMQLKALEYFEQDFKLSDNKMLVFTGDIADRGIFGVESWYIVLSLMLKNTGKVYAIRGNHEELYVSSRMGFCDEIAEKYDNIHGISSSFVRFGRDTKPFTIGISSGLPKPLYRVICGDVAQMFMELFSLLPSALYIGKPGNFVQVCHGGMPLDCSEIKKFLNNSSKTVMAISDAVGASFRWGNFISGKDICENDMLLKDENKAYRYVFNVGIDLVKEICSDLGIKNILRGHTHNGAAVSIFTDVSNVEQLEEYWTGLQNNKTILLENNFTYTFMSCPQGGNLSKKCKEYGFGVLHIDGDYKDWTLTPHTSVSNG